MTTTTEPRRVKARTETRPSLSAWLDAMIAICLSVLGATGALLAMQNRPYLGTAAADLASVPARVNLSPNVPALGLFIVSIGFAAIGLAWFVVKTIHWRFFPPVDARRVWRQSIFAALFVMGSAWLQVNRALSLPLAVVMLGALVLVEVFLNIRGS